MSGSNHLTDIRSITLSDSRYFFDIAEKDGTHSKEVEDGVVLTITIEKGKLVKHAAHDSNGNPLRTFRLQMASSYPGEGSVCYVCSGGGDYGTPPKCYWTTCRWGPINTPPE